MEIISFFLLFYNLVEKYFYSFTHSFLNSNQQGLYGAVVFAAPCQSPCCSDVQVNAVYFCQGLKVNDPRFFKQLLLRKLEIWKSKKEIRRIISAVLKMWLLFIQTQSHLLSMFLQELYILFNTMHANLFMGSLNDMVIKYRFILARAVWGKKQKVLIKQEETIRIDLVLVGVLF